MKYGLLRWLQCPACGCDDLALDTRRATSAPVHSGQIPPGTPGWDPSAGTLQEVEEGSLTCRDCGRVYGIEDGIPRLVAEPVDVPGSAHTRTEFDADAPEWEAEFLDFASPLGPGDFLGRLALDVGCGFGRGAVFAARYGAEVVAMDVDAGILGACRDNTRHLPLVHVVEADVRALPFKAGTFDLAYAFGLLHHLDDPWRAFGEITERLRSGGRFSVWVYGPRQGTSAAMSALLRGITRDMPTDELLNVSRLLATVLRVSSHTPYRLLRRVPGMHSVVTHLPLHDHHRWPYDVVVADIFDRLRVPVTHTFTREDLESRYVEHGYLDVQTSRRVRNNESYRATGVRR
jgi:SAM-dependent methyltransferase